MRGTDELGGFLRRWRARRRDLKIEVLGTSSLGTGWPPNDLQWLGRVADLFEMEVGDVIRAGGERAAWRHYVIRGAVVVRHLDGRDSIVTDGFVDGVGVRESTAIVPSDVVAVPRQELRRVAERMARDV